MAADISDASASSSVPVTAPSASANGVAIPDILGMPSLGQAAPGQDAQSREDQYFLNHAKEYVELHDQIETSKAQLDALGSFLSTFQTDLSSVSGHISDLQGRSKQLEAKLQSKKDLENLLGPFVKSITLPPEMITLILDTDPGDAWLPVVPELESRLTAIRSGPRVESRRSLDDAAEKIRIKTADKLRTFLIDLLTPYRTSVSSSLQALQAQMLLKYSPFFAFLQRLAPRQAHEVQKAYISTAEWYYQTGFRRYVRMLERIRLRSLPKDPTAPPDPALSSPLAALANAMLDGAPAVPGVRADESSLKLAPEALFRSISLVVLDNASSEYDFLVAFFGSAGRSRRSKPGSANGSMEASDSSWDGLSVVGTELDDDSASISSDATASATPVERHKQSLVDHVWRQVFGPGLEYARNFCTSLFDPAPPPVSALAMIRLNDAIAKAATCRAAGFEQHLAGLRLALWPIFQKGMDAQAESFRKLASTGVLKANVKEDAVKAALRHYAALFTAVVALSEDEDEGMVFASVLRLRGELQKLLDARAAKLTDPKRSASYMAGQYEDLLKLTRAGPTSHPRCQAEIAHWREQARRAG